MESISNSHEEWLFGGNPDSIRKLGRRRQRARGAVPVGNATNAWVHGSIAVPEIGEGVVGQEESKWIRRACAAVSSKQSSGQLK